MKKKVNIVCNLNCSRRQMDVAKMEYYLRLNDFDITENQEKADYIIVSTCGFINETTKAALNEIEKAKKTSASVIVTGCVPDTDTEKLKSIYEGVIIHNTELEKFDEYFGTFYKWNDIPIVHNMSWGKEYFCAEVSRGCPENCSYCATKWAVGKLRSKTLAECIAEIETFNQSPQNKVVINGDNVGAYGLDIGETFGTFIKTIPLPDNKYTALIDSFHPRWMLKYESEVLDTVHKNRLGMIVSAFQAGSERILKLMRRPVSMVKLKVLYKTLKLSSPNMVLGTEVIVGFPTETEDEFQESIKFVLETQIDWGHIFAFSPKEGTDAAAMEGQIEESVKYDRIKRFIKQLEKYGYVVHMEEKSHAVIFCRNEICIGAEENVNSYWQHCFDTICPDRNQQLEFRKEYIEKFS